MAGGHENIVPYQFRSAEEAREAGRKGGKASGAARRKKSNFRKTLNALLTAKIDHPDWTPFLESLGLDSTVEAAVNAAMIREALNGNVKAYEAIARYSGQSDRTDADQEEQKARIEATKAQTAAAKAKSGQDEEEEAPDDGFLEALKGSAAEDWEGAEPPDEEEDELEDDKET